MLSSFFCLDMFLRGSVFYVTVCLCLYVSPAYVFVYTHEMCILQDACSIFLNRNYAEIVTHAHTQWNTHTHTHTHAHAHTYIRTHTHTKNHTHTHTRAHTHAHSLTHTHTHTHIHTHTVCVSLSQVDISKDAKSVGFDSVLDRVANVRRHVDDLENSKKPKAGTKKR
mmetsp:Transcript_57191/g.83941  ORF Transcript_57191/g.83941 Transcript_57191/m.83941 type:complete len:167 (-) Transcript_57191:566-1066(-)